MPNAEFEIDHAVIADLLKNDPVIYAELLAAGKEAMEHWYKIAPVNKYGDESAGRPHKLKSGYVDEPGDYRDSIRMVMRRNPTRLVSRVEAVDYKVYWLEGIKNKNKNNLDENGDPPEPMMHTLAFLLAHGFSLAPESVFTERAGELGDLLSDAAGARLAAWNHSRSR